MQINQPTAPEQPKQTLWTVIGAAWKRLDKKNREMLTVVVGNTRSNVKQITFNAGDKIFLRPNVKRAGKLTDPDYQVCVAA